MRINPYHVPSHGLATRIALRGGRTDEAEAIALHICGVASDDPRALLALARVRLAQGRAVEARRLARDALKRAPDNKAARHLLQQAQR